MHTVYTRSLLEGRLVQFSYDFVVTQRFLRADRSLEGWTRALAAASETLTAAITQEGMLAEGPMSVMHRPVRGSEDGWPACDVVDATAFMVRAVLTARKVEVGE